MWRCDPQRMAASPQIVPQDLRLLWSKDYGPRKQTWDDPLNLDLMTYDRVFEPIVMDGRLFLGFNDRDKLVALSTATGETLWTFFADAPVRLPPVGWNGRVYFCSDDGFLYCLDASNGELVWKFDGAPSRQLALGNQRLISAWPARGGPVIRDGVVYFTTSIWPFMGTFIYALDADTGSVHWVNDSTGAQYIKQPHSAPSFAGVAPQGALVATETSLIVPGGRSVPAVFERSTGKFGYFEINAGGKGTGGSFVNSDGQSFFVHTRGKGTRAFNIETGLKTAFMPNEPVLANGHVYSAELAKDKPVVRCYRPDGTQVWEVDADGSGDLILASDELIAAGAESITFIQLPRDKQPAKVNRSLSVAATVERIVAADDKLFLVTRDGKILVFGSQPAESVATAANAFERIIVSDEESQDISELLASGDAEGYAFWFGKADSRGAKALSAQSPFNQLAIIDDHVDAIAHMRQLLDRSDLYGQVTVHQSDAATFMPPKHVANMLFIDGEAVQRMSDETLARLYESVRPYGGVMHLLGSGEREALATRAKLLQLEQAEIQVSNQGVIVRRVGALPGSADWTHQYGDIANTIKSDDSRVKLPLGVLWFGGSSNSDVLPRHGHGPPEQVVGGRLFIQGINRLNARDVYTGRVLWQRDFDDLGTFDVFYDSTYEDTPLDPKYNQVHIPGANARGTNYVATEDCVYVVEGNVCHALDPATGKTKQLFRLPSDANGESEHWGYIGVYKDVLIGGVGFAKYGSRNGLEFETDKKFSGNKAGFGSKSLERAASLGLVGFDRHSGEQLWQIKANTSFWHNGIVAGNQKIYCLDKHPQSVEDALRRRGRLTEDRYRIVAIDSQTGEIEWRISDGIFGTWLGYSEELDLLLHAGASASDRLSVEVAQGMAVYRGSDGALAWKNEKLKYAGPCILHNDLIITNANSNTESAGAFYLQDGTQKLTKNPITGILQPWRLSRAYGCNSIVASENLLTFRSGAAGFFDLLSDSGTGNLGGFKSGCTSNLVVANGVLNAPDYTRTCSCAYQNQTSLALVHMPDVEMWSVSGTGSRNEGDAPIESLAINLGAPGDRRDASGTMWLEFPIVAGDSPPLSIKMNDEATFFQHHSSTLPGVERAWVFSSGVEEVTDVRIQLPGSVPETQYDLELLFAVPSPLNGGKRVFDVWVQDELAIENVTLDPNGDLGVRNVAHAVSGIQSGRELTLRFEAKQGNAVLSGFFLHQASTHKASPSN